MSKCLHSLFLSIAVCRGLASTIAFGGEILVFDGSITKKGDMELDEGTVSVEMISHKKLLIQIKILPSDMISRLVLIDEQLLDLLFKGRNQLGNFRLIVCKISGSNLMFQM